MKLKHRLASTLRRAATPVVVAFRSSLQLRVVSATLVASGVLVLTFGFVVAGSVTSGLIGERYESAIHEVREASTAVGEELSDYTSTADGNLESAMNRVIGGLESSSAAGPLIMLHTADDQQKVQRPTQMSEFVLPVEIRQHVEDGWLATQYATYDFYGEGEAPYLIVGTEVDLGVDYHLYYLYPLDSVQDAVSLLRTNLILAGVALVLLLGVIAALVTRLVVTPVREAARTAQRLAAGLLHERMDVRGSDDLARLANSFNLMAANLQTQINKLEEMSMRQRRFTSDVSHELRTPLTTIRMAADLLYEYREDFGESSRRSIELLEKELQRFEDLLGELLEISRFDSGFANLETEAVNLVPIVEDIAEGFDSLAESCGVTVTVHSDQRRIVAEVDVRRFQRIVRNLIGNAIEHAEGQPVEVRVKASETAVAVAVRDWGVGLSEPEAERVFDRFWRADPSRARQTGGTGLGLAISLEDAKLHRGTLQATGTPGGGSLFLLTLPLHAGNRVVTSPLALTLKEGAPHA
ncbi:MtrAB system histidine kinase MtrB [Natronoglycomyces albus]|uniref:Sensor histidine kinase MtrB n=1 Tax=Natronoglycomyces albus TaxID=2811108 RepID=A0A895XQG3_9ACTN|nr:MtrAB system histidine kinase MtrB [Natronoglycomyces albus]QSB05952.1 HAMP domain-containing histidine kinase [Natronoglycomyces albus]